MWRMDARRTLAGRYELVEVIGRGGMGTVYRATDPILRRTVTVKLLPAEFAEGDPVSVARFEREARAAASLAHRGIVAVYDTGVDEGTRFIVMEYVAGRSVEAILREERRLQPARAVDIAMTVADALGAAHAAGIVHRDVKPSNVMIADGASVKVLDFGIARALDGTALTHSATVLGTAAYMAPEQVLGHPADERSDIYSLGCVLYAMIAGRPPFAGETVAAILHQQVNVDPQPLRTVEPTIPEALDALVTAMLAKSPDARPQSTAQVRDRLAAAHPHDQAQPIGATAPTARRHRTATHTPTARVPTRDPPANHRRPAAIAAAFAGLALVVLAIALLAGGGSPNATHTTTTRRAAAKRPASAEPRGTVTSATASTAATTPSTAATKPAATTGGAPAAPAVAGSAGALTALLTRDVEAGGIEQHAAQQLADELTRILNSYELGHTTDLPQELAGLTQQVEMLEGQGQISPAAAPTLDAALANLDSAITNSAPETNAQNGQPDAPGAEAQPEAPGDGHRGRHLGHHPHD